MENIIGFDLTPTLLLLLLLLLNKETLQIQSTSTLVIFRHLSYLGFSQSTWVFTPNQCFISGLLLLLLHWPCQHFPVSSNMTLPDINSKTEKDLSQVAVRACVKNPVSPEIGTTKSICCATGSLGYMLIQYISGLGNVPVNLCKWLNKNG